MSSSTTAAAATAATAAAAAATPAAGEKKYSIPVHEKSRGEYTGKLSPRFPVPDEYVRWDVEFPGYAPITFIAKPVADRPVWADKPEEVRSLKFNQRDGKINRISFTGKYQLDAEGRPLNPCGRTGMNERGLLGRFGPNHAADPIVTRWKRTADGSLVFGPNGLPVLEFIAIKRKDNNEWAIPGGMVDAGEVVSVTLKREFAEETMNSLEASEEEKKEIHRAVEQLFNNGREIYRGYVDDPRNTDNAWMETTAMLFHDEKGVAVARFKLKAGDDAGDVAWTTITEDVKLYASHRDFVLKARQLLWDDYHGGSSPPAKRQ